MITTNVNGKILIADSSWDSGRHKGFYLNLSEQGSWNSDSPNTFLTKEQISPIGMIMLTLAKNYIESNERGNGDD